MPKNTKHIKVGQVWKDEKVNAKLGIGTRKNRVSALQLSTKELTAILADGGKSKWHQNASAALASRN